MSTTTKGLINRGDFALYDGVNSTVSRVDSTGGTVTNLPIGNAVDILQVYGTDYTAKNSTTLANATQKIGSNPAEIIISPGTWAITDNITIPANFSVKIPQGAILSVSSGKTLTINGNISTGLYQIFSGLGSVVTAYRELWAEWFGLSTTESRANNATAFSKAATAAIASGCALRIGRGKFPMTQTSASTAALTSGFAIIGSGDSPSREVSNVGTVFDFTALTGSQVAFQIYGASGADSFQQLRLKDFAVLGPSDHNVTAGTSTVGLKLDYCAHTKIENVTVQKFYVAIHPENCYISRYSNVVCTYNNYGLLLDTANSLSTIDSNCVFSVNKVGIAMSQGSGITINSPDLESCTTGIYINPKNSVAINDIIINTPYFEQTTLSIDIGRNTYWTLSGTIGRITVNGGFYDSTGSPIVRNCQDFYANYNEQYVVSSDFDATVAWSMPPGNRYSTQTVTASTDQVLITEFFTHIDNSSGHNPQTITLPDITVAPIGIPFIFKRTDAHANPVRVAASGAQLIDDAAYVTLATQHEYLQVIKDTVGTDQWRVIAQG